METTLTQTAHPVTGPEKPKRRRFSAEYKLRLLEEAERCTKPGEIGLLLRREGIYASHLTSWRAWRRRAHGPHAARRMRRSLNPTSPLSSKSAG